MDMLLNEQLEIQIEKYLNQLESRRYAKQTIRCYCKIVRRYLKCIYEHQVNNKEFTDYLDLALGNQCQSASTRNIAINAIKIYFILVENRIDIAQKLKRPKPDEQRIKVINRDDIRRMINITKNIKNRCIIMLAYGTGMKCAEILALKPTDLNFQNLTINVSYCQKKSIRKVPLPESIVPVILQYCKEYHPKQFLFEGRFKGSAFNPKSFQRIVQDAAKKAGIIGNISPNILRHSFGTHLLESGANINYVKDLMGHKSLRTTTVYLHIAKNTKPPNPLDAIVQ